MPDLDDLAHYNNHISADCILNLPDGSQLYVRMAILKKAAAYFDGLDGFKDRSKPTEAAPDLPVVEGHHITNDSAALRRLVLYFHTRRVTDLAITAENALLYIQLHAMCLVKPSFNYLPHVCAVFCRTLQRSPLWLEAIASSLNTVTLSDDHVMELVKSVPQKCTLSRNDGWWDTCNYCNRGYSAHRGSGYENRVCETCGRCADHCAYDNYSAFLSVIAVWYLGSHRRQAINMIDVRKELAASRFRDAHKVLKEESKRTGWKELSAENVEGFREACHLLYSSV